MKVAQKISHVDLQCSACEKIYDHNEVNTVASCERCQCSPIIVRYTLPRTTPDLLIIKEENSMWRYQAVLPVLDPQNIVSLGEGFTPILRLSNLEKKLGVQNLFLKDESLNPTGSFKARGLSAAISKAKELGIENCIIPTAGNAGGAMAAYCAKAKIQATVVMPRHTPSSFKKECQFFGAELILVDGLISDCAKRVKEINTEGKYFDLSTMKEPYRLEGKKTLGYEIAEQMNFELPDVILYPTGGGTGLLGIWKALHEMIDMGWISGKLPRMIAVQSENCQPVLMAMNNGIKQGYQGGATVANGLAVPAPFAMDLILKVIAESKGTAIGVSDEEIVANVHEMASQEGILVAPEGAALTAALKKLLAAGKVNADEKILLLNTGSAYKYLENL